MKRALWGGAVFTALLAGGGTAYLRAAGDQPAYADFQPKLDSKGPLLQPVAPPVSYNRPSPEEFAEIDAHPLSNPSRMPVPDTVAGGNAVLAGDLSLMGLIIGAAKSVALIKVAGAASAVSVAPGDAIQGWQVLSIAADGVTLRGNGGTVTLPLRSAASDLPAQVPVAAASSPRAVFVSGPMAAASPIPGALAAVAPAPTTGQPVSTPKPTEGNVASVSPPPGGRVGTMIISPPASRNRASRMYGAANGAVINPRTGQPEL